MKFLVQLYFICMLIRGQCMASNTSFVAFLVLGFDCSLCNVAEKLPCLSKGEKPYKTIAYLFFNILEGMPHQLEACIFFSIVTTKNTLENECFSNYRL